MFHFVQAYTYFSSLMDSPKFIQQLTESQQQKPVGPSSTAASVDFQPPRGDACGKFTPEE